jgi:ribosomal protein S18 acetylase RimI-like enzyme
MTEVGLDVDAENATGALRLYERVGFRPIKRDTLYRKPLE